jgi:sugar phosphate isomerase/epimerase
MELGFVSAILPDLSLEEVLAFAAEEGFSCVEIMCWPVGPAERRYAGVTHLDVTHCRDELAAHVRDLVRIHGVKLSALGYYPNPLDPNPQQRQRVVDHLCRVIQAAPQVGVTVVNTFIGRDPHKTVAENWQLIREVWPAIITQAQAAGVRIGIEHCPMLFSDDQWPGGWNVATTPAIWRELFSFCDSIAPGVVGLNFDPSHLVWQGIDIGRAIREFGSRIFHVHAKDERIDRQRLYEVGIYGYKWHIPKLPGLGDVNWSELFAALTDVGYRGPVCIEVEDRAYEASLEDRKRALRQARNFLRSFYG